MKKLWMMLLTLFITTVYVDFPIAAEQDIKGSKDHPLLSRMPDFYISEYKSSEFEVYKFIGQDKKQENNNYEKAFGHTYCRNHSAFKPSS